jgi:hypothetical protein
MRFGIISLLIAVASAALVVRIAMWQPMLGGLLGAAWLAGLGSHLFARDRRYGWLRGAVAGLFWFAVSPILIVTVIWVCISLPPLLFGVRPISPSELLGSVSAWAPYVQAIASGIIGALTGIRMSPRLELETE